MLLLLLLRLCVPRRLDVRLLLLRLGRVVGSRPLLLFRRHAADAQPDHRLGRLPLAPFVICTLKPDRAPLAFERHEERARGEQRRLGRARRLLLNRACLVPEVRRGGQVAREERREDDAADMATIR